MSAASRFAGTWLGRLPVPLPANYLQGIDTQRLDFERGLPSYAAGTWSDHGWWWFYLYGCWVKVPHGTQLLFLLAIVLTIASPKYRASWRDEMVVLLPGIVLFAFVSSQTGFSIHFRYVLPAFPFFFVWMSKVGRVFEESMATQCQDDVCTAIRMRLRDPQTYLRAFVASCLLWSAGSMLWHTPHWLSYFNELAGGPLNGPKHLLDSNIDWGQDLLFLKKWQDDHPESQPLRASLTCSYDPAIVGLKLAEPPPPWQDRPPSGPDEPAGPQLKPGWYALSVNMLYDRSGRYAYFREHFQPTAYAGYSIYIYHLSEADCQSLRTPRSAKR